MQGAVICVSPGPKSGPPPLPRSADDIAAVAGRNRILVIEDDPIVSLAMENLLADAGYVILASCARGDDALPMAERLRPNLILADVKLSGSIDGVDAVAAILARRRVPVIFATAHSDPIMRARMMALAPAEILVKPIPDVLLLHTVAAALRG